MDRTTIQDRLTVAQAQQQQLQQQRARLVQLLDEASAQLHVSQGRIAELTELIALHTTEGGVPSPT